MRLLPFCLIGLIACSSGSTAFFPSLDAGDAETFNSVADQQTVEPFIDTKLSKDSIQAGASVTVTCTGNGFDRKDVRIDIFVPQEDTSQDETFAPSASLPDGVTLDGFTVTVTKAGYYGVRCYTADLALYDEEPSPLTVTPATPVRIETFLDRTEIKAGEWIQATCEAFDRFDNKITSGFSLSVTPPDGVKVSGLSAQLTRAVRHRVACEIPSAYLADTTPVEVVVTPNIPKKIYTYVTPSEFKAGGQAEIECVATDAYENKVPDLPMSVALPAQLTILGKTITGVVAGIYTVKCVPETIPWRYFQIFGVTVTVKPGDPSELVLKVVPDREFYSVGSKIDVIATILDEYQNIVPDASVAPPTISPPNGIEPSPTNPLKTFILREEGIYIMTFRVMNFPEVSNEIMIKVEGSGPLITILYPERGATIQGKPSVTVVGTVNDDVTGIASFTINGIEVPRANIKPDGTFTFILNPHQGMNMIDARVVNGAGMESRVRQSYYFSFAYYPVDASQPEKGMVHNSVRVFLHRDFFDDGDHDPNRPDDLATILENMVVSLDINSMIPNPVAEQGPYKVYIRNVRFDRPTLNISLFDGGMWLYVRIPNLRMNVYLEGECNFIIDWCPDFSGSVRIDTVTVTTKVLVWTGSDKKVHARMQDADASLEGIDVNIDGLIGWLFGWLIDILVNSFASDIEKAVEQQLGDLVNDTIEDLFAKFEINETFEIPPLIGNQSANIGVLVRPQDLTMMAKGMKLSMEGSIYAPRGVSHDVLGSISRANCLSMTPSSFSLPERSELEFAAFDDLINEALFSVWWSGTLNMTITQDLLGDVDLSEYGVTDLNVALDFYLPPILTDCNQAQNLQAQVGDLYADVSLKFNGIPLRIGVFVYAIASVDLSTVPNPNGGNDIAITLLNIDMLEFDFVSIMACPEDQPCQDMSSLKDVLEKLIKENLLPSLLEDYVGKTLFTFEIPTIDLSTLDPTLPSVELRFAIERLYRDQGFTVARGHLE